MRPFAPLLLLPVVLSALACEPTVAITGFDIGRMFPEAQDHFWKYNHGDDADIGYLVTDGVVSPAGEDWLAYRFFFGPEQDMVDAFSRPRAEWDHWSTVVYFVERRDGWYLMGWDGNPSENDIGGLLMDDDGLPFAVGNAFPNSSWTGSGGGKAWTVTTTGIIEEPLEFNSQVIESAWHLVVADDAEEVNPMEGEWWLVQGSGIVQFNAEGLDFGELGPWQHQHNDLLVNITGVPN